MAYWDIVTRSFGIAWRHKYLWLIAIFAGESAGGGGGGNAGQGFTPSGTNRGAPNFGGAAQSAGTWLSDHAGLIVAAAGVLILVWIAFFILGAICEGATVRASAEHDAERPFGLGLAWRAGLATLGPVLRLRLIIIALLLPVAVILIGLAIGLVASIASNSPGAAVVFGGLLALCGLAAIPYAVYVGFLDRLGTRSIVLEQVGALAGLGRGRHLVRERLGRVLLVWLLSVGVGIVVGIAAGIVLAVVAVPFIILGVAAAAGGAGPAAFIPLVLVGVVVLLVYVFTVGGYLSAQASTYWTLAFRRLELDPAPAVGGNPYAPPPQPGAAAPPTA